MKTLCVLGWSHLGNITVSFLHMRAVDLVPRVELGQNHINFNVLNPSLLLNILDTVSTSVFLILTQEIK